MDCLKRMILGFTIAVLFGVPTLAKDKGPAPCKVYFTTTEHDEITVGVDISWLNKPQSSWYKKHGDRDNLAGICYVPKVSDAPTDAPVYLIVWGEHLAGRPYTYTYQTTETVNGTANGTVTDNEGNTANISATTTTEVPVQHTRSGVNQFYVADGWLAVWDDKANSGKGDFVPIGALANHNITKFTSASASLLKDAMEQIREREALAK